jgi:hypothetical protein
MSQFKGVKYRRGQCGYANIMVLLDQKPRTIDELKADFGSSSNGLAILFRALRGRIVRVVDWKKSPRGPMAGIWGVGSGPDAPCPGFQRKVVTSPAKPEAVAFIALVQRLQSEPATVKELCEVSGLNATTALRVVRALRPLIYIHSWDRSTHVPAACWAWGKERDADRPKKKSQRLVCRDYYWRKKARLNAQALAEAFSANDQRLAEAA